MDNKAKTPTTCCKCDHCECGDNCTCPKGEISCDPCAKFVNESKGCCSGSGK